MRERPLLFTSPMVRAILAGRKTQTRRICKPQPSASAHTTAADGTPMRAWWETGKEINDCPYGFAGDRLWVRETWANIGEPKAPIYAYRADTEDGERVRVDAPWKPSIHMPRAACRLVLKVTDVRVERLQSISEADAMAEGTQEPSLLPITGARLTERSVFAALWESINGADSWAANPWVWAITFKRVTP